MLKTEDLRETSEKFKVKVKHPKFYSFFQDNSLTLWKMAEVKHEALSEHFKTLFQTAEELEKPEEGTIQGKLISLPL